MCGFCLSVNDGRVDIRRLTESIKHRGPDSTRYYVDPHVQCGFNRLAIVDDDERSDQPMRDPSGRYLLVFNGEIYNHNRLRTALVEQYQLRFATRSDTEVLLQGLIREGADFVARLDGIFAFVFVDLVSLDVLVARDVFGVKPLYYFSQGDRLYVSSEVRPLRQMSGNQICRESLARYLSYGVVGRGEAIVTGVSELEPNTIKLFRAGRPVKTTRVHEFSYDVDNELRIGELRDLLYETIESQKPEIPYGVLFSGGLDSTLILSRCVGDRGFAGAYSVDVDHPDMSERQWQEYALDVLDAREQWRRAILGRENLSIARMNEISRNVDHPLFHPNFIGSFLLTRMASEDGLKVLLSGEGADELFLGYRWFFSSQPPSDYLEYVPLQDMRTLLGVPAGAPIATADMTPLEIFQKIYLQRWLIRQDLTGMANSIEVRVPFLGLELARMVNALSFEVKRGNGESKWIIKQLMSERFSNDFLYRKKVGFDFPLNDWMGEEHLDLLRAKNDLFDGKSLDDVLAKHRGSYMRNRIVFSLVSLSLWRRSLDEGG